MFEFFFSSFGLLAMLLYMTGVYCVRRIRLESPPLHERIVSQWRPVSLLGRISWTFLFNVSASTEFAGLSHKARYAVRSAQVLYVLVSTLFVCYLMLWMLKMMFNISIF